MGSIKQWRRRGASWNKKKSRQNENTQRNNMIKSKQISFGVTCANVFILKCVLIRTLHGGCYLIKTKTKKQAENEKHILWKVVLNSFSIFHTKILHMTK